jgi:glycosyltransferase involved in cell wall biosynthesis
MRLCLAVPCYRDADRLERYLPELYRALEPWPEVSVVVVDDGSGREQADRIRALVRRLDDGSGRLLAPVFLEPNRGKGGAVYAGWDAAPESADWLGFVDADGAIPAVEVARVIEPVRAGDAAADAIFASRVMMLGRRVVRSKHRHVIGRVFATLTSMVLRLDAYDTQCGFKLVRRSAYLSVRPTLTETRFAFDVDLLAALLERGMTVREIPIDWQDVPGGKVSILRDSLQMATAVWKLRRRAGGP